MKPLLIILSMLITSFGFAQHKYVVKVHGQSGSQGGTIINGTGFVKANGTTISYDTSTYISRAVADAAYATLTGRSGGQVLNGGTAPGESLTLSSTSNAIKGKIYLNNSYYDETGGELVLQNSNNTNQLFFDPTQQVIGMQINGSEGDLEMYGRSLQLKSTTGSVYLNGKVNVAAKKTFTFYNGTGTESAYAWMQVDSASNQWVFGLNNNYAFKMNPANGNLGIGDVNNATARLEIQSGNGTAGSAPIKLNSGILLTTPETGAIEYDGNHYYGTIGTTRYQLDQQGTGGIPGGRTIYGGTASGENLTLTSTSNAAKGYIYLGANSYLNETSNVLHIGLSSTNHLTFDPSSNTISALDNTGNASILNFYAANTYYRGELNIGSPQNGGELAFMNYNQTNSSYAWIGIGNSMFNMAINDNWILRADSLGHNGIGNVSNPSARLEIQFSNGAAGTAPIKLESGTLLTTPENGALEYDGTNYFVTTNGVRYTLTKTLKGTAAPTITPAAVGIQYVDTTNKKIYISTGTSSSTDWTILN